MNPQVMIDNDRKISDLNFKKVSHWKKKIDICTSIIFLAKVAKF